LVNFPHQLLVTILFGMPCNVERLRKKRREEIELHRLAFRTPVVLWTTSVVKWSDFLATDPELLVRFPALPNVLSSSASGNGSTQRREYN
jgi:hypothetical protein